MNEVFNSILYALTIIFGIEAPIYSGYTEMNIDLNANTIELYFYNLQTSVDYEDNLDDLVGYLDSLTSLDSNYHNLNLTSNSYELTESKYNYQVQLKFSSHQAVKEYFKIDFDSMTVFVHPREIIKVNSFDTLDTETDFGKYKSFNKSDNLKYMLRYDWDYEELDFQLIPLSKQD
jgi:hypothetical protein